MPDEVDLFAKPKEEEPHHHVPLWKQGNLRERAAAWIRKNPGVVDLFLRFALEMASRRRRFGIGLIAERVRWEGLFQPGKAYAGNNSYRAYIARWRIAQEPALEKWMQFRKVRY